MPKEDHSSSDRSFDDLARAVAEGSISRRRALKLFASSGPDLRPVLLELAPEQVMISGLAGDAVSVLSEHNRDPTGSHEVPHTVHTWPLKAGAALSRVRYFFEDLVPFTAGVVS